MAEHTQGSGGNNLLIIIATALIAFAGGYLLGNKTAGPGVVPGADTAVQGAASLPTAGAVKGDSDTIPVGTSAIYGNPAAPITIVEFSDFQCPFCGRGADTMKALVEKYPNDVRVVFKHNPLAFHAEAPAASKAAMAAGEQGKFWEMHDILFKNQKEMKGANMKELTSGFAKQLGLDVAKFQAAFDNPKYDQVIKDDMALGAKLGVRGTPHFFVNGERVSGAQPIDKFETIVKAQLEEAKKMVAAGVAKDQIYAKMVSEKYKAEAAQQQKPAEPASVVNMVPVRPNDPMKGNTKDYLVTIVEFSDFQCPFCTRVNPTIDEIMKNYGDKVRVVFKQNALAFHKEAGPAAEASLAAHEQGKFWEMHDMLFANQKAFGGADMTALTTGYAQELGLNVNKFKAYLESGKGKAIIKEDMDLANKVGARGTPNFFVNGVQVVGAKPYPAFDAVIKEQLALAEKVQKEKGLKGDALYEAVVAENKKKAPAAAAAPQAQPEPEAKVAMDKFKVGNSFTKGPKNAPVTIYEFSDFQCPYCTRANATLQEVYKQYEGKIQIVFKAFPLPFHQEAEPAHRAALAAGKQGKFWEMHDKFFGAQQRLKEPGIWDVYAKELGLNMDKFKKDFESDELKKQVQAEMQEGQAVGVRGTPAFFINGTRLVGAQPIDKFKEVIDAELKAAKK